MATGVRICFPLRAAEQRSDAGGSRRALSEPSRFYREGELRSRPAPRAAPGSPQDRRTGGRLLLVTFLGEARKVTSRRAAPGEVEARRFAWATSCPPYGLFGGSQGEGERRSDSCVRGPKSRSAIAFMFFAAAFGTITTSTVVAQPYPYKPIRILSAEVGGGADLAARVIAQRIAVPLGKQVIVENRPGRVIGDLLVKATPDGYTLLLVSSTIMFAPVLEQTTYDATKDFAPISMVATNPNIVVVHASVAATSIKELIALAKAKPGALNYGSGGTGSSIHLAVELFKQMAGVDITRVSYKGAGPALNDLLGGQIQLMFATAGSAIRHVSTGRLRALAVTSAQPSPLAPGLPTVAAAGLPGYEMVAIYAVAAPLKTPPVIVRQLNQAVVQSLADPELKERFLVSGMEAASSTPEALAARIKAEVTTVAKLIKDARIRAE